MTTIWDNDAHDPSATVGFLKYTYFNKSGPPPLHPVGYPYVDELNNYVKVYINGVLLAEDLYPVRNFKVPVDEPVTIRIELMNDLRFSRAPLLTVDGVWNLFSVTEGKIGISQSYAEITHTFNEEAVYKFELHLNQEPMIKVSHEGEGTQLDISGTRFGSTIPKNTLLPGESVETPANLLNSVNDGYKFVFRPLEGYELTGEASVWKEDTQTLLASQTHNPTDDTTDISIKQIRKEDGNLTTHMTARQIVTEPVIETRTFMIIGENTEAFIYTRATDDIPSYLLRVTAGEAKELEYGKPYDVTIQPDVGYEFSTTGTVSYETLPGTGTQIPLEVSIIDGKSIRTVSVESLETNMFITIETTWVGEDPNNPPDGEIDPTEILGFNNIYSITKKQLMQIHKDIYKQRYDWGDMTTREPIDPYNYLINTLRLPFEVPIYNYGPNDNVTIGYHTLTTKVRTLTRDKFILDMGKISVDHKYNNSYDFKNTDVIVHLPYINPITIDPSYAIGQTISIQYIVDAYSGETTINLSSTLTKNNIFYSAQTMIGNTIPVITPRTSDVIGNLATSKSVLHNNTPIPFVEIIRNIPYQIDSEFNSDTLETVETLHGIKGRVYVHNISLESDSTISEQLTIKSILAGGVIIK